MAQRWEMISIVLAVEIAGKKAALPMADLTTFTILPCDSGELIKSHMDVAFEGPPKSHLRTIYWDFGVLMSNCGSACNNKWTGNSSESPTFIVSAHLKL